ncbi:MAG: hypothetical protein ACYS0I_07085 [Planctomycetota bacterium]|jgi:hypothetical protein
MKKCKFYLSILILLFSFFFLLVGCSTVPKQSFQPALNIPEEKSLVYIYSQSEGFLGGFHPAIRIGDNFIVMPNRTYYYFFVDPGVQRILAQAFKSEDKELTLEVKQNQNYYVKVTTKTRHSRLAHFEIEQVSNQIGEEEIKKCQLGSLLYGKTTLVKGYYTDEINTATQNKAIIQLYRAPSTLYNSGIGDYNIGLYSGNGSNMVGVGLDQCETYKFYAEPGLVKCVLGNMAFSGVGKAAFFVGGAMTGVKADTPGKEFTEIETGLGGKKESWNFDADAGKIYYLEFDPHKRFKFIDPGKIKSACLANTATVIEKRDTSFIKDIKSNKQKVGIAWIRKHEGESAQYYSKVRYAGGVLDYLYVEIVKNIDDAELKNRLSREMITPKIQNKFLNRLELKLKQYDAITKMVKKPFIKNDSQPYRSVANNFDSKYVYLLEILNFGITRTHSGILPIVSSNTPVAFASIKGIVIDNDTKKELFRKPFNGVEVMSDSWDDPPGYEECLEKLDKALESAIMAFIEDVS